MRILSVLTIVAALAAAQFTVGCGEPGEPEPDPVHPVLKLFYGNLFAHGSGKSANLGFSVTVNEGDKTAALPLTMTVAGRVANLEDNCAEDNRGWNSSITISSTTTGYGLTGTIKEKDACKGSSSLATYLSMNLAIDSSGSTEEPGYITGAFPPGSGSDIVVADLTVTGIEPTITIDGRLRLNTGDVHVTINVDANGSVDGVVDFPGNEIDINGQIDLTVLGQVPAQTLATSLLANAIVMARY